MDTLLSFHTEGKIGLIPGRLLQADAVPNELGSWLGWPDCASRLRLVVCMWDFSGCTLTAGDGGCREGSRAVGAAPSKAPSTSKSARTIDLDGHGKLNPWIYFHSFSPLLCPLEQGPKDKAAGCA